MMMEDLIVNLAPTGMIPTKKSTSFVPISPDEIVDDVLKCSEVGITMVHIHAREKNGEPAWRPEIYDEIICAVRKYLPELIVCVTCSGRTYSEFEKRSAVLELEGISKPDMGSLTLSSLNFNKIASVNSPDTIMALANKMNEKEIKPELESFDLGMVNYAKYLIRKGILKKPYYFNLIFGNIACAQANMLSVGLMCNELPPDSYYSFGGVGDFQLMVNSLAIVTGAGVRVGLEDTIWYDEKRTQLATNHDLVKRVKSIADTFQREIMLPVKLRRLLGLKDSKEGYGIKNEATD
jgi:uncharacterized protein (DUF849 family)